MDNDFNYENYILETMRLVDSLRSHLIRIDEFEDFFRTDERLRKLKKQLNDIYWSI